MEHHHHDKLNQLENESNTNQHNQDRDFPMIFDMHILHVLAREKYTIATVEKKRKKNSQYYTQAVFNLSDNDGNAIDWNRIFCCAIFFLFSTCLVLTYKNNNKHID